MHGNNNSHQCISDWHDVLLTYTAPFGLWNKHVLEWWKHKDDSNVLFLKFEDLKKVIVITCCVTLVCNLEKYCAIITTPVSNQCNERSSVCSSGVVSAVLRELALHHIIIIIDVIIYEINLIHPLISRGAILNIHFMASFAESNLSSCADFITLDPCLIARHEMSSWKEESKKG